MLQKLKQRLKNQRGMTLVELLAVIVILGIISAIAVPSIGGLIDNSKKDAHIANAQQMMSAAKMAVADNPELQTGDKYITLEYLQTANYIETIKDPDGNNGYTIGTASTLSEVNGLTGAPSSGSYVKVTNGTVTAVKLVNSTRGIQGTSGAAVAVNATTGLSKSDVK